ncbi:hypothetical protein AJ79_02594 [Helicocarpus griseus UAMH5409]|uniref:Zinc transporter n=1 Tax=Helicocarpus griseus UAMH5409 TaxID=1447875 RepID=A0A2B7Y269_9EURO|nr:hypothetical protein AJ79_02594 [Helicocarpus griseus UAMH5409]
MSAPSNPPMDIPVRGGLHPAAAGHRRSRGTYTPLAGNAMSISHPGPLTPPSENSPVYTGPEKYTNGHIAGPSAHSHSGHARHYSESTPQLSNPANEVSVQAHNWSTLNGNGGSLGGMSPGFPAAPMLGEQPYILDGVDQEVTLIGRLVSSEIIAGILVSAPYVILSFMANVYNSFHDIEEHHEDEAVELGSIQHHSPRRREALIACTLTSITMIIMGLYAELRKKNLSHPLQDSTGKTKSTVTDIPTLRDTVLIGISIGLPFYASLLLDPGRVIFTILALLVSGVSPLVQLENKSNLHNHSTFRLTQRKGTICFLLAMMLLDATGFTSSTDRSLILRGYLALFLSVFIIQPPFAHSPKFTSVAHSKESPYEPSAHHTDPHSFSAVAFVATNLYFQTGAVFGVFCFLIGYTTGGISITIPTSVVALLAALLSTISFAHIRPSTFQSRHQLGFVSGSSTTFIFQAFTSHMELSTAVVPCSFIVLGYILIHLDLKLVKPGKSGHSHGTHEHGHSHHHSSENRPSRLTRWLLKTCEHWPFMYGILKEKDSRRIFYFMCLNFGFMLVQLSYGIVTGSLGLLSDSIHMFFDCFALAVGLCAAVMSKWPPSVRFPYGYGKVDTLAGFANGVFLMIISIEIIYEAVERLMSGSEVHRIGELLLVSAAGLVVNMVGIMAFDHGHHHGHSHSHGGHDHDPGHPHPHHTNENMHGIFLHILADALGSVAVVISTILVHFYKWPGFDPIASCLIAILIFVSAVPLVASTSKTLVLALPADVEYSLRDALAGVSTLRGVVGYAVPKFWLDDTVHEHKHKHHGHHHHHHHHDSHHGHSHSHPHDDSNCNNHKHDHDHDHKHSSGNQRVLGVIHVVASRSADMEDVRRRTINYLADKDIDILVQVEREGESKCWCGGGNSGGGPKT